MNNKQMASPQKLYDNARRMLLLAIVFTVVNMALAFLGSGTYFLFSVFLAYMLAVGFGNAVGIILAALVLAPYVLAYFLSKRKRGWLIAALVMISVDTLLLILLGISSGALLSLAMDFIFHGLLIGLLAIGVKNGKAALGAEDADPYHPAEAPAAEEPYTDLVCALSVSEDGHKFNLQSEGVARFYETELALGMKSFGRMVLVGSVFTAPEEKLRCPYGDIVRAYWTKKNERTVRFDFADGRAAVVVLNRGNRDQFVTLLNAHGVAVEPFAQ